MVAIISGLISLFIGQAYLCIIVLGQMVAYMKKKSVREDNNTYQLTGEEVI
jgi:hypothetical protein